MTEEDLNDVLIALLPIIRLEEKITGDKCKYMVGTQSNVMMIKANQIMLRVGGGYATFQDYIKQVGPFECIKIYKMMKNDRVSFKDAVIHFLTKLKALVKIIENYRDVSDYDQAGLFESAIEYLKHK